MFTADTLWIHKANPDDEDLNSFFPVIKCDAKPTLAESINKTLQMEELGFILNEKGKAQLKSQPKDVDQRINRVYAIRYANDRLLTVDIGHFERTSAMTLAGNDIYHRYYFDAQTGTPVSIRSFFTDAGFAQLNNNIVPLLRQSFIQTMRRYQEDFSAEKEKDLDTDCGCQCTDNINHSFCAGAGIVDGFTSSKPLTYSINSCHWTNPGNPNDFYRAIVSIAEVKPFLSDYGKYIFLGGTPVTNNVGYNTIWKGKIGEKIPISFSFKATCTPGEIKGLEVYDNYGVCIPINGKFDGRILTIHELAPDGKTVATIEATFQSGKFAGQWKKADGTKTLAFTASALNSF